MHGTCVADYREVGSQPAGFAGAIGDHFRGIGLTSDNVYFARSPPRAIRAPKSCVWGPKNITYKNK